MQKTACICTIGDEILIGQIVDTNSSLIANKLNLLGYRVDSMISISDNYDTIVDTLEDLINKYKIVIVTGGLGPTKDDITKHALATISKSNCLVYNEQQLSLIQKMCSLRGIELSQLNRDQALVPENSDIIVNYRGTAPGHLFKFNLDSSTSYLVSLPGVPYEMEDMIDRALLTISQSDIDNRFIYHKVINTFGIPESTLAHKISSWEDSLPKGISLAYLPNPISGVRLRLSTYSGDRIECVNKVEESTNSLKVLLEDDIYGYEDDTLESVVLSLLSQNNLTLSIAESCTGGNISSRLVSVPNASRVYLGGVIAYSNNIKNKILNVDIEVINRFGAVSRECVEQMALGVMNKYDSSLSLATTGIAGPSGDTLDKPIGLIWISVATKNGVYSHKFISSGDRVRNIQRFSSEALNFLRKTLLKII